MVKKRFSCEFEWLCKKLPGSRKIWFKDHQDCELVLKCFPPNRLLHPWRASKETCVHVGYPVELRRRRRMSGVPGFYVHSSHYTLRACVLSEMYWGRNQDFGVESSLPPLPRLYWNGCTSGSTPWSWGMYWWDRLRRRVALELQGLISHRDYQNLQLASMWPVSRKSQWLFGSEIKYSNQRMKTHILTNKPAHFVLWSDSFIMSSAKPLKPLP